MTGDEGHGNSETGSDDDWDDMTDSTQLPGAGAALTGFLADLRALGEGPAPDPTPDLAAMLGGAVPLATRRRSRHAALVRRTMFTAAVTVAGLVLVSVAAASRVLPAPAQRVVSNVVNFATPFHIDPDPGGAPPTIPPTTTPATTRPSQSSPQPRPTPSTGPASRTGAPGGGRTNPETHAPTEPNDGTESTDGTESEPAESHRSDDAEPEQTGRPRQSAPRESEPPERAVPKSAETKSDPRESEAPERERG